MAGRAGDRLTRGLQAIIQQRGLPFVAYNQGSICHLETVAAMFIHLDYWRILRVLKEIKARKHGMEEYGAPDPAHREVHERNYRIFKRLHRCNRKNFALANGDGRSS